MNLAKLIQVAYFGLAAAGVVCLALLNRSFTANDGEFSVSRVIQDLSVLVAEVEAGALVHVEDPNYALLAGATQTIKSLLDRIMSDDLTRHPAVPAPPDPLSLSPTVNGNDDWSLWESHNLQDFEVDFWLNLAEHPSLLRPDSGVSSFP